MRGEERRGRRVREDHEHEAHRRDLLDLPAGRVVRLSGCVRGGRQQRCHSAVAEKESERGPGGGRRGADAAQRGRAVQVDPMKPKLKPPGAKRLKLNCDTLLSTSAFRFNLRRYNVALDELRRAQTLAGMGRHAQCGATRYGALHQREGLVSSPAVCSPNQIHH